MDQSVTQSKIVAVVQLVVLNGIIGALGSLPAIPTIIVLESATGYSNCSACQNPMLVNDGLAPWAIMAVIGWLIVLAVAAPSNSQLGKQSPLHRSTRRAIATLTIAIVAVAVASQLAPSLF